MGAKVEAGSPFIKAVAKKMETPSKTPSFEDVLNLGAPQKPSPNKVGFIPENAINIFDGALAKAAADKQKKKELKEMQSKESADKYEASIKQAALEKLKAEQQAKKEKYGSYSPFSKSDMPTAQQYQNPYPEYLFKGKAPQYGEYGSNFMSVTAANNPLMQQGQKQQQAKMMEQEDKIKQLFAMIAQSKQGQQPPVQG